jgi:hypothetical protein
MRTYGQTLNMKVYYSAIPLQPWGLYPETHRSWRNKGLRKVYSSTNIIKNSRVKGDDIQVM